MSESEQLSDRERELLQLVATGASNKEIAQKLSISPNTVKVHLRNIFAKTGVASRTEATLYAIKNGIVTVEETKPVESLESRSESEPASPTPNVPQPIDAPVPVAITPPHQATKYLWLAIPLIALAILIAGFGLTLRQPPPVALASPVVPTVASRWQQKSAMPTSRSGLAAANYEGKIYVIGGETDSGVTSVVESYAPSQDEWTSLAPKPIAVADVGAGVIAGKVYVPGGRLADGTLTNVCEVYDPKTNLWSSVSALPTALSGYALVSFEGKLYLFGGNTANGITKSVYIYDPGRDVWSEGTPMPTARAFAGAAVAGGKIFVMGGYDGEKALNVNEEYVPEHDNGKDTPWLAVEPLPNSRYSMGMASIADIIYLVGGLGDKNISSSPIQFFHQQNRWQSLQDQSLVQNRSNGALIAIETYLYSIGGRIDEKPTPENFAYRAIYTVIIPQLR